jgi:hypothetical protein
MGTIYLTNILHTILLYSKHIAFNVTIKSRPFMIIIIFEYTSNMVVHIHSKYTFINLLHPIIFFRIHKIHHLYTYRVATKLVTFVTNGTYIVSFWMKIKLNVVHMEG